MDSFAIGIVPRLTVLFSVCFAALLDAQIGTRREENFHGVWAYRLSSERFFARKDIVPKLTNAFREGGLFVDH